MRSEERRGGSDPSPDRRPVTRMRDIAVAARVSQSTVSAVLTGKKFVRPETRERIEEAIARLQFSVNHGARALAVLRGRRYVLPSDVAELAPDVLRHRLVLSYAALTDGITPDAVVSRVLGLVPAPQLDMAGIPGVAPNEASA